MDEWIELLREAIVEDDIYTAEDLWLDTVGEHHLDGALSTLRKEADKFDKNTPKWSIVY